MKKLILGATGSIGSALAKKIVTDGDQVHLVGRDESSDFWSGLTNRWVNAMQICLSVGDPYEDLV